MMQRWREKLKYIEAGLIVTSLIMFVVSLFVDYENTCLLYTSDAADEL